MIEWEDVFDETKKNPGATEDQIAALTQQLKSPIPEREIERLQAELEQYKEDVQRGLRTRALPWRLPQRPLPEAYLHFLRWSNGGDFSNGERCFYPVLPCEEVLEWTLGYSFPLYMPMALPFALNGGGSFYAFDMREKPVNGEYPILFVDAAARDFGSSEFVAHSLLDCCQGRTPFI